LSTRSNALVIVGPAVMTGGWLTGRAAVPVPEAAMVPVPLVASLWTVTVPL